MLTLRSLFVLLLLAAPAAAGSASGPVRVVDADTIDIGWRETMRLLGIDAPEGAQTCLRAGRETACGAEATAWARAAWEGRVATCRWDEVDRYDRPLATCRIAGADIAAGIVAAGWALTYREDLRYDAEEKDAIFAGRGLHAYEMQEPHEWRAAQRAARAGDFAPDPGACQIKGNISERGRLYHLPGMRSYGATRISEAKGERWFCSEGEARAAGWRRAGGG